MLWIGAMNLALAAGLPAGDEPLARTLGFGLRGEATWLKDEVWSPLPAAGQTAGLALAFEPLHEDRLDRTRLAVGRGQLDGLHPDAASFTERSLRVDTLRAWPLASRGAWTGLMGWGAHLEGALREGVVDTFDARVMAELVGALRWSPAPLDGRLVLDAGLRLPVLGVGLRPFPAQPYVQDEDGGPGALNLAVEGWHRQAAAGLFGRASLWMDNGNAVYLGLDWRGHWTWIDPALARVGGGLELGLLLRFGSLR